MSAPAGRRWDAVLLDLDGTLTDPREGITRSIRFALERLGLEAPPARELEDWIGPPLRRCFEERAGLDRATSARAVELYREYFAERGIYENRVHPGIPELLARLRAVRLRLVLATSKPGVYAERVLAHFALREPFEHVIGSFLDGRRVEKRELVADALTALGDVACGRAVMVGDREHDMHGARACGIASIAVTWGFGSRAELRCAERLADTPAELLAHLTSAP